MAILQTSFVSSDLDELDSMVNSFNEQNLVIATQCYAFMDGVPYHVRVLFYKPIITQ